MGKESYAEPKLSTSIVFLNFLISPKTRAWRVCMFNITFSSTLSFTTRRKSRGVKLYSLNVNFLRYETIKHFSSKRRNK